MRKMKKYVVMFCALLVMGASVASCSSDEEVVQGAAEGKGLVKLSLNVGTEFQSRAITESDYTNLANYTVQILKDGNVVSGCEWTGEEVPDSLIELDNGSYTLLAFTGEDYKGEGATTQGMYVEGTHNFDVQGNQQVTEASVTCTPQCARVTVEFDSTMADYFNDYYVVFTGTDALGERNYTWEKDDTDPVYMAVAGTDELTATIKLVDKEGKVAEDITRTHELSAGKAWKLTVKPMEQTDGSVGIEITVDDSTEDIDVDIEIPTDWL